MIKRLTIFSQLLCTLFLLAQSLQAQVPQVANRMQFAGMDLRLTEQAQRDIQSNVDALYRSEKHFNIMLERVDLYMPVIEPILLEHGVPAEFKYLVIQESALIGDAVSSSNAVGYWQFKESSATELGLLVNRQVDERMNIHAATTGAAKYLLRSNAEFDNWLYTLQSYMVGQGGTSRTVDRKFYGARQMKIDSDTHWYIKKFLSHLVAFEHAIGQQKRPVVLYEYTSTHNKTLTEIAREFDTEEEQLLTYNKWLKSHRIPEDRNYTVIIPLNIDNSDDLLASEEGKNQSNSDQQNGHEPFGHKQQQPEKPASGPSDKLVIVEFNNLKGVVAREGDQVLTLAALGNMSENRFRKLNDLSARKNIQAGQFYYLQKKKRRARVYEHVLQPGESLWEVAQRYGIRLDKLLQKNRMSSHEEARPGRVLWLRFIRPRYEEVEHRPVREPKEPLYASTKRQLEPSLPVAVEKEKGASIKEKEALLLPAPEKKETTQIADPAPDTTPTIPGLDKQIMLAADSPVIKPAIMPEQTDQEQGIQKNTSNSQNQARDIQLENKEKSIPPPENSPKQAEQETDSFFVEEPVQFMDDDEPEGQKMQTESISTHVVESGETLYALSRRYGISVQELIAWNDLPKQPVLNIGQQIRVVPPRNTTNPSEQEPKTEAAAEMDTQEAAPEVSNSSYRYHEVSPGESMYRVARMYQVTIKDIMEWNNKENFDLREGERLIVGKED